MTTTAVRIAGRVLLFAGATREERILCAITGEKDKGKGKSRNESKGKNKSRLSLAGRVD